METDSKNSENKVADGTAKKKALCLVGTDIIPEMPCHPICLALQARTPGGYVESAQYVQIQRRCSQM